MLSKIQYYLQTQYFQGFQELRPYMIRESLIKNRLD